MLILCIQRTAFLCSAEKRSHFSLCSVKSVFPSEITGASSLALALLHMKANCLPLGWPFRPVSLNLCTTENKHSVQHYSTEQKQTHLITLRASSYSDIFQCTVPSLALSLWSSLSYLPKVKEMPFASFKESWHTPPKPLGGFPASYLKASTKLSKGKALAAGKKGRIRHQCNYTARYMVVRTGSAAWGLVPISET